jgi:hypothetical protein
MSDAPARMARIGALVSELDALEGRARTAARELVAAVLELHRSGLETLFAQIAESPGARAACLEDPLVSSLLVLHDLHPVPLEARVRRALDEARARLGEGASLELVSLQEARIRVRITAPGRSSTAARQLVEEAICRVAPDSVEVLVVDGQGRLALPVLAHGSH